MIYVIIPILIVFIIFIIALLYYDQANTIDNIKIKIEEVTKHISIAQEKEIEILTKISKDIQKNHNKKAIPTLSKIKNKSLNIFQLDEELWHINQTLKEFVEDNNISTYYGMNELHTTLIEIKSLKIFFNQYSEKYNKLISKVKYILIKIIKKERKMELFQIQKEVEFEILKDNKNNNQVN